MGMNEKPNYSRPFSHESKTALCSTRKKARFRVRSKSIQLVVQFQEEGIVVHRANSIEWEGNLVLHYIGPFEEDGIIVHRANSIENLF